VVVLRRWRAWWERRRERRRRQRIARYDTEEFLIVFPLHQNGGIEVGEETED
jgi:PleD family two-component response regulator